jgi:hypothetical protein
MIRAAISLLAILALGACATTQGREAAAPRSIEAVQAARMAELLRATAEESPERIRGAQSELIALERALTAPQPTPQPVSQPPLAAPPDLTGSRSLMSGVHLASYREYANAVSGWAELQVAAPNALLGLEARLSEADLGERGVFLRLKAGPLDSPAAARALCAELEAAGHWCNASDFDGTALTAAAD